MKLPLEVAPGIFTDDTNFAAAGRWSDGSNVRFYLGRAQTIGGWESLTTELLGGVCRTAFNWTDNIGSLNAAFGTHATLEVWVGGALYDITPTLAYPSATLANNPFTVADGSALVTVAHPSHGLTTADSIVVTGAHGAGRIEPNGTFAVTVLNANSYTFTYSANADLSKTLANNPLTTTNASAVVTVSEPAHKIADGTTITVSGAAAVGGITPNGTFVATVIDANSYKFTFTSGATSAATGGGAAVAVAVPAVGGGSTVSIAPQNALGVGAIDGTGGAGYGTGAYGVGNYSEPSTAAYYPRTWALGPWGQKLLANVRGGAIYEWSNNIATPAAPVANSPRQVSHMVVASANNAYWCFALGCNEEASGLFNPTCIRHSSVRNNTVWNTSPDTTAREYTLPGGGRIVGGRVMGSNLLVWTDHSLFLGSFQGALNAPWRFDRVGEKCGLIGPNAAVVVGQTAFWIGPDLQFYRYTLGGAVSPQICPILKDFADNLTPAQGDKIVASSIAAFSEIRFDYPDNRDGVENSRYLAANVPLLGISPDKAWYRGIMSRTAMVDAGPSIDPIGTTAAGNVYWHERGQSADGQSFAWFIETADQYLSEDRAMMVRGVWPDIANQIGPVWVTLTSRFKPQGEEVVKGPYGMGVGEAKTDMRANGRLFRVKFAGESAPTYARLGRLAFDVTPTSAR